MFTIMSVSSVPASLLFACARRMGASVKLWQLFHEVAKSLDAARAAEKERERERSKNTIKFMACVIVDKCNGRIHSERRTKPFNNAMRRVMYFEICY